MDLWIRTQEQRNFYYNINFMKRIIYIQIRKIEILIKINIMMKIMIMIVKMIIKLKLKVEIEEEKV